MDRRIWESLQRLTVVANKLSFQRVDVGRDSGPQERAPSASSTTSPAQSRTTSPEPDWETNFPDDDERQLCATWNRFQQINRHTPHHDNGEWVFTMQMVTNEREYGEIIESHSNRTPIGRIVFGNGSYYKFVIRVHDTHRDKMEIDASGSGGPAGATPPYTIEEFNYTGTPEEIAAHLNGMIGDPISPRGVEEIIHGFYL